MTGRACRSRIPHRFSCRWLTSFSPVLWIWFLVLIPHSSLAQSIPYPGAFAFIQVPVPLAGINPTFPLVDAPLPAAGAPFWDPRFGTLQTRVTETDGINSRHEYSRFDPFNADGSMILLLNEDGGFIVYRTAAMPYNQEANRVLNLDIQEPRWDAADPRLVWGLQDYQIVTVDVSTGQRAVIKDFTLDPVIGPVIQNSTVYRITTQEEGEASQDFRYWVFMLQGDARADYLPLYFFTWDRETGTVPGVYPLPETERAIDWVGMSCLGNYVLIGGDPGNTGNTKGLTLANRELNRFHQLAYDTAHSDVGLDAGGREVIVMQNSRTDYVDLIPLDWTTRPVLGSNGYATSGIIPLIRLFYSSDSPQGLQSGVHISCNYPGYAVISTTIEPGRPEQNWLDRSMVLARLDKAEPDVYYLAKQHNTTGSYWEETHAAITRDGSKIVWADNWGQNIGENRMFLMQLDMPPRWTSIITGIGDWMLIGG
ncbi:MAG: hypothetical protein ACE15F_03150 [bacterium]